MRGAKGTGGQQTFLSLSKTFFYSQKSYLVTAFGNAEQEHHNPVTKIKQKLLKVSKKFPSSFTRYFMIREARGECNECTRGILRSA